MILNPLADHFASFNKCLHFGLNNLPIKKDYCSLILLWLIGQCISLKGPNSNRESSQKYGDHYNVHECAFRFKGQVFNFWSHNLDLIILFVFFHLLGI